MTTLAGTQPVPASGQISAGVHRFPLRVYFEDTDLGGVVYHANYLRFLERARSDLLHVLGIDQQGAFAADIGVYVVADLNIRYVAPATLGDALIIDTWCSEIGAVTLTMQQRVRRADQLLAEAQVRVGFLTKAGRPQRQPADWLQRLRAADIHG